MRPGWLHELEWRAWLEGLDKRAILGLLTEAKGADEDQLLKRFDNVSALEWGDTVVIDLQGGSFSRALSALSL